jgi:hypothetical protein
MSIKIYPIDTTIDIISYPDELQNKDNRTTNTKTGTNIYLMVNVNDMMKNLKQTLSY